MNSQLQPNSPQWTKKVHSDLAALPSKTDISCDFIISLANNLITGKYISLAWNLLVKYFLKFNHEPQFLNCIIANFTHFDNNFKASIEILDYLKIKGLICDAFCFSQNLDNLGIIRKNRMRIKIYFFSPWGGLCLPMGVPSIPVVLFSYTAIVLL